MSGAGAEGPAIGLGIAGVDADEGGEWAVERRAGENWSEVERFGSEEKAREALDEIAARNSVPLEDLRVRRVGD
jgi:hypothetical protein